MNRSAVQMNEQVPLKEDIEYFVIYSSDLADAVADLFLDFCFEELQF